MTRATEVLPPDQIEVARSFVHEALRGGALKDRFQYPTPASAYGVPPVKVLAGRTDNHVEAPPPITTCVATLLSVSALKWTVSLPAGP